MPAGDARGEETDHRMTDEERDPEAAHGPDTATDDTATAPLAATDGPDGPDDTVELDEDEDEDEDEEPETAPAAAPGPAAAGTRGGRRARSQPPSKAAPVVASVSEQAVHIGDRASAVFTIGVVGVFVAILLYGMLLGHGGFVTNLMATPTPAPTVVPVASASPSAAASPAASTPASVAPSAAPSGLPSPSPAASPSPSAS